METVYEVRELFENTWMLEDGHVRIFFLAGTETLLIVDSGISCPDIRAAGKQVSPLPQELFNTHADPDHISANAAFESFYMHPSEAHVYRHLRHGKGKMIPVFDGDLIDLGGRKLEVIHLPGHTPGSVTLLDKENRALIGGDPIQADGDIFMFGSHRDLEAYIGSLRRLMKRESEFDMIYPSHAKIPVGKDVIPELIKGAEKILAGKIPGEPRQVHGTDILVRDIGITRFLCEKEQDR